MRRSNRWTTCWGLFLFSSSAAVLLLLGLGSSSSSSLVEAAATRTETNRRAVRKTTKARQNHLQRSLQSGKGGKGGSSAKGNSSGADISNNAGVPSSMLATIGAIDAMNHGILEHQNNAKKSTKGSSSGGGLYGDGGSTPTTTTNPTTGTIIQPNQGGSTEEIISGNVGADANAAGSDSGASNDASSPLDTILDSVVSVVSGGGGDTHGTNHESNTNADSAVESSKDDVDVAEDQDSISTPTAGAQQDSISTGTPSTTNQAIPPTTNNPSTGTIAGPQDPTNPGVVPPNSGTTDESFFDGSTTVPDHQQDVPKGKDEENISTDQFANLGYEDADFSDQSDNADGEGDDNVVIIMPTPGHDDTTDMDDETSAGLPDFKYGSNINNYSPNQPGKGGEKETEDDLKTDSIGFDDTVEEMSEKGDDDKGKGKGKDKPAVDEDEIHIEDAQVSDADPNNSDKPAVDEDELHVEDESQSINILPNDESEPSTSTVGDDGKCFVSKICVLCDLRKCTFSYLHTN